MKRMLRASLWVPIAVLLSVSSAEAFCLGDPGWQGFIVTDAPVEYGVIYVESHLTLQHLLAHPECYGELKIAINLNPWMDCGATGYEAHFGNEGNEHLMKNNLCPVPCGIYFTGVGVGSWQGPNGPDEEFDEGAAIRFTCPECQPPPGGCSIEGCVWDEIECACVDCCPLVFDTSGKGYKLTSADRGVLFDINADGVQDAISWTDPRRDVAFLGYDRNGNRLVDDGEELFGNVTPLPAGGQQRRASHGFDALASLESEAYGTSVADGIIDQRDAAYHKLLLWHDANHDGLSQPAELKRASEAGLLAIETRFRKSTRRDEFGNEYRLRGISWWQRGKNLDARLFYDVWFVPRR